MCLRKKSIQIYFIYIIKHLSFIFNVILAVAHKYVEMTKTVLQVCFFFSLKNKRQKHSFQMQAEHIRMENV